MRLNLVRINGGQKGLKASINIGQEGAWDRTFSRHKL